MTAGTAAAVAATLRVLQLASSASQPAVPAEASRQVLQEMNRAAGQSDTGASSVLLTCVAEAVALQQIISEQVSMTSTINLAVSSKAACNRTECWVCMCASRAADVITNATDRPSESVVNCTSDRRMYMSMMA